MSTQEFNQRVLAALVAKKIDRRTAEIILKAQRRVNKFLTNGK